MYSTTSIMALLTLDPSWSQLIVGDIVDAEILERCKAAASHPPIFVDGPWKICSEAQAILREKRMAKLIIRQMI